jgi:hypothetical protein
MSRDRGNEWVFFVILNSNDIWTILKKFMYVNKKKSNIHNYRDGDVAAYYGYLGLLKNNDNLVLTENAMNWAAKNGHLEVIKWLHTNRFERCTINAMNWAAQNGREKVDGSSTFSQPAALRTRPFRSNKMVTYQSI